MKALRHDSTDWTALARRLPPAPRITIMHLGRGGVMEDGTLDYYNQYRVLATLDVADDIKTVLPGATVTIHWTGGCNRAQDRTGARPSISEAGAAIRYARIWIEEDATFKMQTEEKSTSTVENATRSAGLVATSDAIVVVSDRLHYVARKVQFIMWLVFPHRRLVFIELPTAPDATSKSVATHLISTIITVIGMVGVRRGDAVGIQRRQDWLQRLTRH